MPNQREHSIGIKTLDPADAAYFGFYFNSDNSANFNTGQGFNYHCGPEWVLPH